MYESTQDATWAHGIDLAQEPDFDLGSLRVRPARCEVASRGITRTLQRRVMQVLVALAQARGAVVSQSDLVVRCWRGLSVSDDAIYRCISKLRKLAADYSDTPFEIEAIPGVGYRLTSSGVLGDHGALKPAAPRVRSVRLRAFMAAAAFAVLALLGATFWIARGRISDDHPVRVAVQPFDTLSNSDDARALARRIPNEIVNEFGDSQIMTVLTNDRAAREASQPVGLIVTGLVRNDTPEVSVDVRVEDGRSHAALWSMEFKRDRREASDLPMEVAARVADVVNMAIFARSADPPLTDDSALSALLQATDMIRETQSDWAQMIERAQSVVSRHPKFAFGHDVLAVAYAKASQDIDLPDRAQEMKEAARREANLTLKLDPQDAGAYAILSGLEAPDDYRAQEAILLRGIKFAKHPKQPLGGLYSYEAALLSSVGRLREALSVQLIAHATDEWGPPKTAQLARAYANVGNLPAAREWIQKGVQLWPNHSGIRRAQLYVVGFYEQPAEAAAIIDARSPSNDKEAGIWRAFLKARTGPTRPVPGAVIKEIRAGIDGGAITPANGMMMLAALGEPKQAIEAVNGALDHRLQMEPMFLFAPVARDVREEPSFVPLANRLGLIRYWRETGKWPDFCTDRAMRNECSPQLLAAIKSR